MLVAAAPPSDAAPSAQKRHRATAVESSKRKLLELRSRRRRKEEAAHELYRKCQHGRLDYSDSKKLKRLQDALEKLRQEEVSKEEIYISKGE